MLRAAISLADETGIESVTMRKLAQELGVEAMTLYYYVANKDEILGGIVDAVVGEIELPSPGADWKAAIRRTAISAHSVLLQHEWAASLLLSGQGVSLSRLQYMDSILGSLREGGFSADMTDHAYHALDSHIMGFTLWEVGISLGLTRLGVQGSIARFLQELDIDEYPHLAEHAEQHLKDRDPADEGEFEFGLDLILDGLERLLNASAGRR